LYSASTDKQTPPPDTGKFIKLAIIAIIGIIIFAAVGNQAVILSMNFTEFGDQFSKPLYYTLVSTIILSAIALIRINITGRSSIFWYVISTGIGFLVSGGQQPISTNIQSFRNYKLSYVQFVIWQADSAVGPKTMMPAPKNPTILSVTKHVSIIAWHVPMIAMPPPNTALASELSGPV